MGPETAHIITYTSQHTPRTCASVRPPIPGDVIIFHPAEGVAGKSFMGDDVYIKRVVAVEGDTVEVGTRPVCVGQVHVHHSVQSGTHTCVGEHGWVFRAMHGCE